MNHLFVDYETAKLLKEKGFDEPCIAEYIDNGVFTIYKQNASGLIKHPVKHEGFNTKKNSSPNYMKEFKPVCAPIYQQIVDWFREDHNIFINVEYEDDCYSYSLKHVLKSEIYNDSEWALKKVENNYYSILSKAINKALKLI